MKKRTMTERILLIREDFHVIPQKNLPPLVILALFLSLFLSGCSGGGGDSEPQTQGCPNEQHLESGSCVPSLRALGQNDPELSNFDPGAFSGNQRWDATTSRWGAITTTSCKAGRMKVDTKCSSLVPIGTFSVDGDILPRSCSEGGATTNSGSTSEDQCLNAPGHIKVGSNIFTKVPAGQYVSETGGAPQNCPMPERAKTISPLPESLGATQATECAQTITACEVFYSTADGSSCLSGVSLVEDLNPGAGNGAVGAYASFADGRLLIIASTGSWGHPVVLNPLSGAKTELIEAMGSYFQFNKKLQTPRGQALFSSQDADFKYKQWVFDPVTDQFLNINLGDSNNLYSEFLGELRGGKVLYRANPDGVGTELVIVDVSDPSCPSHVVDIRTGSAGSVPNFIAQLENDKVLLYASTENFGSELIILDVSDNSFAMVEDFNPGLGSSAIELIADIGGGKLLLKAHDGTSYKAVIYSTQNNTIQNLGIEIPYMNRFIANISASKHLIASSGDSTTYNYRVFDSIENTLTPISGPFNGTGVEPQLIFGSDDALYITSIDQSTFYRDILKVQNGEISSVFSEPSAASGFTPLVSSAGGVYRIMLVFGRDGVGAELMELNLSTLEQRVFDLNPGAYNSAPALIKRLPSGKLLLAVSISGVGREIGLFDPLTGAITLYDINPGGPGSVPSLAGEDDDYLYIGALKAGVGRELFKIKKSVLE